MKSSYQEFKELMPKQFSTGPDSATGILFGTICYILDRRIKKMEKKAFKDKVFYTILWSAIALYHLVECVGAP